MNKLAHCVSIVATGGVLALILMTAGGVPAMAAGNPVGTGQPSQECGEEGATMRPGHSMTAPGSAFNPDGIAGTHYAGEQPQNSRNLHSVSQYDVACFQVTQSH